jgi:hypothetical protein
MSRGVNILFGRKAGKIGELQLDVTVSEQHEYENEVSIFPIEEGADIADHIKLMPESITLDGFVTNSPISVLFEDVSEVIERKPGEVEVKNTSREGTVNRVELAQDVLLKISGRQIQGNDTTPQIVDIITGLRVYTGMAMTSLTIPRNARTGQAMNFTARFIKIVTVKSETVAIPDPQPEFKDKTQSKNDKGKTTPAESKEPTKKRTSLAKNGYYTAKRVFQKL